MQQLYSCALEAKDTCPYFSAVVQAPQKTKRAIAVLAFMGAAFARFRRGAERRDHRSPGCC